MGMQPGRAHDVMHQHCQEVRSAGQESLRFAFLATQQLSGMVRSTAHLAGTGDALAAQAFHRTAMSLTAKQL